MSEENNDRYVVVTMISTHRMRYCIPVSEMEKDNDNVPLTTQQALDWAQDSVTMEEVREFSQHWMGEQSVDAFVLDEERTLQLFDRDNDYLQSWTKEQKLKFIHEWKEKRE